MEVYKEKIRYILQLFFEERINASQAAEIVNGFYGADTVTVNDVQFWFRRFRSGIFDVKGAPHTGKPVIENIDKITEVI
ncbi:histone-lysine N-methyltransferase SETMAR [Trichonephila clavipes]|nr:histone-lysine N-methyltransferase SETMAR [Trichonephila clavipes]